MKSSIALPVTHRPSALLGSINSPTPFQNLSSQSMQISSLPVNVNVITSFLHIHLKAEYQKSKYSCSEFIRYRQIIEHAELILVDGSAKHEHLLDLLKKCWMQTIIETCLKDFQEQYALSDQSNIKSLKKTVAERYLFELCKLRQFVQSGRRNFQGKQTQKQVDLSAIFTLSDQNLYHVLQQKNTKFMDQSSFPKINYPKQLQSFQKYKYDILQSFKPKSLHYDMFLNKDYIFQDIRFLLDLAVKQWENYELDMRTLFNGKLETNLKVKKQKSGGFNVVGVRRILTKWVQFLLENDKQLASSTMFYNFIMQKRLVYDGFYMNDKDNKIPPSQQKLCHLLLQLLISSVYHNSDSQKPVRNKQFGLFIYDLLRGKMSVETVDEMVSLVNRLKNPPYNLKNKIEVFRIKNRLQSHNRDILINFRYGNIIAAQIQIGLSHSGSAQQKKEYKKKYQYKHFIYQLSRSIFGPTIQLMNIYQDFYKSNQIKMYSTGIVSLRDTKRFEGIKFTDNECFNKHKLIFIQQALNTKKQLCRSCFQQLTSYLHCFQCTVSFCEKCVRNRKEDKSKLNNQKRKYKAGRESLKKKKIKEISKIQDLFNMEGFSLVIFYIKYSPASNLMLNYIRYLLFVKQSEFNVYMVNVLDDPRIVFYISKYLQISRFPAFVSFFDSDLKKCIIGASFFKVVDLINFVQTKTPSKRCPLEHELVQKKPASYVFWTCNECYKTRNSNNVKSQQQIFYCTQCLYYCCRSCAFCKNQTINYFQDKNGTSYLSTAIIQSKLVQCSSSHKMTLLHQNPYNSLSFHCISCSKQFLFIGQIGMYACLDCQEFKCNFCTKSGYSNISNKKEYANHLVQEYRLDYPLCTSCNRPHKFSVHKQSKQWMCRICKSTFKQSQHISCLKCQRHYCKSCQPHIKSKQQIIQIMTQCSCKQGILKPKTIKLKTFQTFMCMICFNRFYYNQPHHQCQNCKFNYCNSCLQTLKTIVKISILQQKSDNQTNVTLYQFQLPLSYTLKQLRNSLISNKIITLQQSFGKFKLSNKDQLSQQQQQKLIISDLSPTFQVFYIKTNAVITQIMKLIFPMKNETQNTNKSISYTPRGISKELDNDDKENELYLFEDDDF